MTSPFNSPAPAPAPSISLDDAEVQAPKLASGNSAVEVQRLEIANTPFGLTFFADLKVLASDNPQNQVGQVRKYSRSKLSNDQRAGKNLAEVKAFLAAILGVDPTAPQPDPSMTWDQLLATATGGAGDGLKGQTLVMYGIDKVSKSGHDFIVWKFGPYKADG